jgi:hypothetical protein
MAAVFNIEIDQGADFEQLLTIRDDNDNPRDITGFNFRASARVNLESEVLFNFSFEIANQTTNTGEVTMSLGHALSSAVPYTLGNKFIYDVEMVDNLGKVSRVMQGVITFSNEVTV